MVLDFYWYVRPLAHDRLLLWRSCSSKAPVSGVPPPVIRFVLVDLDRLSTFSDIGSACETMAEAASPIFLVGPSRSDYAVPATLPPGDHVVKFPDDFTDVGEILVLSAPQPNQLCLWIVDARRALVSVFPQDWWNRADLDFGYQWVTRVARDPNTGQIVGEGVRIQPFVLDSTCRELEAA